MIETRSQSNDLSSRKLRLKRRVFVIAKPIYGLQLRQVIP